MLGQQAEEVGYPVAIKASAGGGGKGLKIVRSPDELERAFDAAKREGESYFADSTVYVERYLDDPRHVEVQILADDHGNVIHLGERDCTIQRRHQKLLEETPSPAVDDELRERIGRIAVDAARAVAYRSAGTIEGLLATDGSYYFLEMNTRIQVEHTVTEAVTGLDLVREQVLVAAGEPLSVTQDQVSLSGHAIECRINAEDAASGFVPSPGRITAYSEPGGIGVRVDSGVRAGDTVSGLYDPLLAKLIVHDVDRESARRRALRALEEFVIEGPTTLIGFHRALLESPCFVRGETCSELVESEELARRLQELDEQLSHVATTIAGPSDGRTPATREQVVAVEVDGKRHQIRVHTPEPPWAELARRRAARGARLAGEMSSAIVSPMQGAVLHVAVEDGDRVEAGDLICIVEAMKMENEITTPPRGCRRGPGGRGRSADRARPAHLHRRRRMTVTHDERCSDVSREVGERLAATAATTERWLLVEVPGPWPRDVASGLSLPPRARSAVERWLEGTPRSRLLFIRRPGRPRPTAHRLRGALTRGFGGAPSHVDRLTRGSRGPRSRSRGERVDAQLVLVCGHGSRDRCCALRGTPVFGALASDLGEGELWISSHHGGHRFAPNVLVLPAGIQLGHVDPDRAPSVVKSVRDGRIPLEHYRGRTYHDAPVQAAEHSIREAKALLGLDDLRLESVTGSRVRFRGRSGEVYEAEVDERPGSVVPASCGAEAEAQPAFAARVL